MHIKDRLFITAIIVSLLFVSTRLSAKANAPRQTPPLPVEGWRVCEDFGVGSIPGLGEPRQRFGICNNGWEVQAYCLNPGETPPTVGEYCSMLNDDVFWCGDGIQQLQLFAILQIPPTPTPTPTATNTPTPTPTTIPPTATAVPSQTPPAATQAPTARPTNIVRVSPGGPGNLGEVAFSAFLSIAGLAGIAWLMRRRAPR